ncbi:putative transposon-derived protein F52C9.6 [Aphis craccivora]|uniref:Putative transposon-derived protein F52C9.6 n=1 Tax=Aphis craccivora TaxID=307492 RepID=A0A6G0Y435_APHCR|nr:putative transposon-derived protein F52C9.6 [Aphis craccivora]
MTRTSWIEHKMNEEVLNEIDEERTVMNTIMKRTIKLIGHLLINNEFITIIMEEKIKGKRSRGKPRESFVNLSRSIIYNFNALK